MTGERVGVRSAAEIPITENQARSVASALALLDEELCLFEEYGNGREMHSVCYQECNRLTAGQRKALLVRVKRLRELMSELKGDLRLRMQAVDVAGRIWGHSAGFWEIVAEMESKRLKGYGEVTPSLARYLDPRVERLLKQLQALSHLVAGGATDSSEED